MKIYTKTGDDGSTGLFGGTRVSKADARVQAYGDLDELNSVLGVALATELLPSSEEVLLAVQADLFELGAELARAPGRSKPLLDAIGAMDIKRLEDAIDASEAELPPLRTFILPGGCRGAAQLHLARAVCRRAERHVVALAGAQEVRPEVVHYLNRLSDLLFSLARRENLAAARPDTPWMSRTKGKAP